MTTNFKDRFYGVEYYGVIQFYEIPIQSNPIIITPYFTTLLELRTKEGGLKKQWYYTQDRNNPIESIAIEMTNRGCGICKVQFSELMFPIDASDIVRIRLEGSIVYEGIVDNDVDISNPILIASPLWKRLDELLFTGTFTTGTTIMTILQTVIEAVDSDSGINWNAAKVTLVGTPPTLAVEYLDTVASEILNSMVDLAGEMHYWGVDTDRDFFVKRYDETDPIVYSLYSKDRSIYEKVTITEDYSKIEMTEAVVYKKNETTGDASKVGSVGDAGNIDYPPLDIAKKLRRKVGKLTASEYILDETALKWGYESLKKQAQKALTVKISDIDVSQYLPKPDDFVLVEGDFDKCMVTIIECDATTESTGLTGSWTNCSAVSSQGKDENNAIKLFNSGTSDSYFDFGRSVRFYKQERVGFFIRGAVDTVIEVAFSDSTTPDADEYFKFAIADDSLLSYYDFEVDFPFRYVYFKYVADDIYIDDVQVFCESKRQVQTALKKVSLKWTSDGIKCDAEGGNISNPETEQMEKLNSKIKILEAINNI